MSPDQIIALLIGALSGLFVFTIIVLIIRDRRRHLVLRRKLEQEHDELQQELELASTYTTDEERIAAIHRIMKWE